MGVLEDLHREHLERRARLSPPVRRYDPPPDDPPEPADPMPAPSAPDGRDWLHVATLSGTTEITAAGDPLLPEWLRKLDGSLPRTAEDVIFAVLRHREIPLALFRSNRRMKRLSHARHEAAYWVARLTPLSLGAIGTRMGGLDHTTVLHGMKAHAARAGLPRIDAGARQVRK